MQSETGTIVDPQNRQSQDNGREHKTKTETQTLTT